MPVFALPAPPPPPPPPARVPNPDLPGREYISVQAITQEAEGQVYRLRGAAKLETTEVLLKADEIDFDEAAQYAEARGNVHFINFAGGEELFADKVEYYIGEERGKYYNVRGSSPAKIEARPGVLTTTNPFSFQARWAERIKNRYILHDGFVTNCKLPRPWWTLRGPKFDIIPGDRAIAYQSVFRVRFLPIFYTPVFYKSLERLPRQSGFLTPNIGNSSRRGKMLGIGYYWAINRSYDAMYRGQYFTQRGFAHNVDFRGKPREGTDFNFVLYGVNDRGLKLPDGERRKEGGYLMEFEGRSELPYGFHGRVDFNYLSSFVFRQAFTESFYEAIFSEVHSIGYVTKHWSSFGLNIVADNNEVFQSTRPDDKIVIRKLPEVQFNSRERQVWTRGLPLWVSLESSAGLIRRKQPLFETAQFLERMNLAPRVTTALRWKGINLIPSFGLHETHYGEQKLEQPQNGQLILGRNINRHARDVTVDLVPPSLERVFNAPRWLGERMKHVIEPRAGFRHVDGVADFNRIILFDETELLSNTTEADISLTNRLFVKRGVNVYEAASWQVWQRRYFDTDFGGALVTGRRNVVASSAQLTGYGFLDRPRRYSPIVSVLRLNPASYLGAEWRADYDPLHGKFTNSGLVADVRFKQYFISAGHTRVSCTPVAGYTGEFPCEDFRVGRISPPSNQLRGLVIYGNEARRGWMAAFSTIYDFRTSSMQWTTTQVTYNTDCCGISFQFRRFGLGTRSENQFRVAFVVANIGSFGTLKRQERLF